MTAQTIYQQASSNNSTSTSISANCTLVHELLDCLVSNFSCSYMQNYFNGKRMNHWDLFRLIHLLCYVVSHLDEVSHYASVYSFNAPQPQVIPRFVFSFLAGITGTARLDQHQQPSACNRIQDCQAGEYCIRQKCISTMTSYHPAYGTGLQIDELTGKIVVTDSTKGTYTEST